MNYLFDNHTHSLFSDDSKMSIEDAISTAIDKKLGGICFTDHYDFDVPNGVMMFTFDPEKQQKAISEAIGRGLPADFKVLKGIEIGMQKHCLPQMNQLMERHSFDTVVASLHFIDGKDPYHGDYYIGYEYKKAYGHYLETIYECINSFTDFDILGHFDYIARYAPYPQATIRYHEFSDIFDTIFKKLIYDGKTFEINTKTYQTFRGREPQLDIDLLHRFRELGGEFISFGSDAHGYERIGEHFERFIPMLHKAGIKYSVYYQGRKAVIR